MNPSSSRSSEIVPSSRFNEDRNSRSFDDPPNSQEGSLSTDKIFTSDPDDLTLRNYRQSKGSSELCPLPYLLSIHLGRDERLFIPKQIFHSFVDLLHERLFNPLAGENPPPKVHCEFWIWSRGRGLVGCLDEPTRAWIRAAADSLKPHGTSIKAWGRGEFGYHTLMSFFIPECLRLHSDKILQRLKDQNDIVGNIKILHVYESSEALANRCKAPGKYYITGLDKDFAFAIAQLPEPSLYLGLSKIAITLLNTEVPRLTLGNRPPFGPKVEQVFYTPRRNIRTHISSSSSSSSNKTKKTPQNHFKPQYDSVPFIPSREEYSKMSSKQKKNARKRMKTVGLSLYGDLNNPQSKEPSKKKRSYAKATNKPSLNSTRNSDQITWMTNKATLSILAGGGNNSAKGGFLQVSCSQTSSEVFGAMPEPLTITLED